MFVGECLGYFCVVLGAFSCFPCIVPFIFATFLQWFIRSSQGIGKWLRLLVSKGTVASFAAASAFSFPSIP